MNKEKVITALKCCSDGFNEAYCDTCPYNDKEPEECTHALAYDALKFIEELRPITPIINDNEYLCGQCLGYLCKSEDISKVNYCKCCGRKIDWDICVLKY